MSQRVKQQAVAVGAVLHRGHSNLPEVAGASGLLRFFPRMGEHREQKCGNQAEDDKDNQQLDERKAQLSYVHTATTKRRGKTVRRSRTTKARHWKCRAFVCRSGLRRAG